MNKITGQKPIYKDFEKAVEMFGENAVRAFLFSYGIDPNSMYEKQLRELPKPKIRKTIGILGVIRINQSQKITMGIRY